jgi:hypothetical protein
VCLLTVPKIVSYLHLAVPTLPATERLEEALCFSVSFIKMTALSLNARNVLPEN